MPTTPPPRRFAVIGGGFSGLAAALRLHELEPASQVVLFEQGQRVGGVVGTEEHGGFLMEQGADMFTTREPWALGLCRRIGFDGELINTEARHARAFVVRGGQLYPVPEGFTLMTPGRMWPIARSGLLSVAGKLRMAAEYFVPPRRDNHDESLAEFVTRRLGREAFDRLVQPLIGGIYTADPTKLSMQAALPQFVQMEQQHGGLIRAMRQTRRSAFGKTPGEKSSGARYGLFVAPRHGMESLLQAVVRRLPPGAVQLGTPVDSLQLQTDRSWLVRRKGSENVSQRDHRFDAVVVAVPAYHAANLLQAASSSLADELRGIPYASVAIVLAGFRREQIQRPVDGFGIVVPRLENRRILAASLASVKFPGRAPDDSLLVRVFIGGACQPELVELSELELEQLALGELGELLGVSSAPQLLRVVRWKHSMPQYHLGHLDRVARIETALAGLPTLALAGNAYRGVGIPFCIRSGEQAAEKLVGLRELR